MRCFKCRTRLAFLKVLNQHGVPCSIRKSCYFAFIFSHVSYAWPAWCDINNKKLNQLLSTHKRASRLCQIELPPLTLSLDKICQRLAKRCGLCDNHPLLSCFQKANNSAYTLRKTHRYHPLPANRVPLSKSFTKYAHFA